MPVSSYQYIDPHILASISDLRLIAKTVVDGFLLGMHQSPKPGAGLEFNQYRSYQPGDDLRHVDWKMFARSDRYYVRESEIETSLSIKLVLDATASMAHTEGSVSKFDYACFLIASLAYLADLQGDAIGLLAPHDENVIHLPSKRSHQHLHRFLHELERLAPSGQWPQIARLEESLFSSQKREMIVFISDLHERGNEIQEVLAEVSALKNEVLLFHLLGEDELAFNYQGSLTVEDLETGELIQVDAGKQRDSYVKALQQQIQILKHQCHDQGISYELLTLQQPLDFALRNYLTQRSGS